MFIQYNTFPINNSILFLYISTIRFVLVRNPYKTNFLFTLKSPIINNKHIPLNKWFRFSSTIIANNQLPCIYIIKNDQSKQ